MFELIWVYFCSCRFFFSLLLLLLLLLFSISSNICMTHDYLCVYFLHNIYSWRQREAARVSNYLWFPDRFLSPSTAVPNFKGVEHWFHRRSYAHKMFLEVHLHFGRLGLIGIFFLLKNKKKEEERKRARIAVAQSLPFLFFSNFSLSLCL